MAAIHKELDTASLGPLRFLFKSLGSTLSGVGQLVKSPKLLLPTIALSGLWLVLSFLKLKTPDNEFVVYLSILTFAQGGMYAGPIGAVGGVLGKAMISWLVTSTMMPVLTGKKRPKSVKMSIKPAFVISGMRGLALFVAGIGMALVLYNFKTGNGTVENAAVAVAAILGAFRSLKNPRGFIVEFLRSFTKGKMSRRRAGHFVVGLMAGYAIAIYIAVRSGQTGPQWYVIGFGLLVLATLVGVLFKNRKRAAATVSALLIIGMAFGPLWMSSQSVLVFAQPYNSDAFEAPYDLYGVPYGDFDALKAAINAKPFSSAQITPVGAIMGITYTPITNANSLVIGKEKKSLALSINSASLVDQFNVTESYSLTEINFSGDLVLYYDQTALMEEEVYGHISYNELRLPFSVESQGNYKAALINRSDYSDGHQPLSMTVAGGLEKYPVVFDSFGHLRDAYYASAERALYGETMFPGDHDGDLYLLAKLSQGTQAKWSDGDVTDAEMDAMVLFRVEGVSFDEPSSQVKGQWVHEKTAYYALVQEGLTTGSYMNFEGVFKEGMGAEPDGNTLYHQYLDNGQVKSDYWARFGALPSQIESEAQIIIPVEVLATLNGGQMDQDEPNERIVFVGLLSGQRSGVVDTASPNFFDKGFFEYSQGQFVGNMPQGVNPGEEVTIERILGTYGYPMHLAIADTYVWDPDLVPESSVEDEDESKDEDNGWPPSDWSNDDESGWDTWDDWQPGDFDWDQRAGEDETGMVNGASALGALIGAGAAAASGFGGFGGPRGPGNMRIPGGEYDPSDGTLVVTFPGGSQEIYRLNPSTGEFESNYGSTLQVDDLERANRELTIDKELARAESQRVAERTDGDTGYWKRVNQIDRLKKKYEKQALDPEDHLSKHMAKHLNRIQNEINKGNGIDEKSLRQIKDFHGKRTRGDIANASSLPGDYTDWQHAKDTVALTTEEVARGESALAIALRITAGAVTLGKSEFGFEIARSVYTTKDLVDSGVDDWSEVAAKLAIQTAVDEGIGRVVGAGLNFGGSVASSVAKTAADAMSTTRVGSAILKTGSRFAKKTGDFLGQDIIKTTKAIFGRSPKVANSATQAMKLANANAAKQAIKNANQQLDDVVKATSHQVDDAAKSLSKQADDVAKKAAHQTDDLAKKSIKQTDDIVEKPSKAASSKDAPSSETPPKETVPKDGQPKEAKAPEKPLDPHQKAAKDWDDAMNKGKNQAQDEIQKYKEANKGKRTETSQRDELFKRGQQIGDQKVANLKRAQDRMNAYPGNKEAQEAYDHALRSVQQDKYAMNALKEYKGSGANELRGKFNMRNEQHTQAALQNTRERLAQERGVNPEDIKFVEATNTPGAGSANTIDASRTASKVDVGKHTSPNYKGSANADDMVSSSARIKGAPMDKDVTGRVYDPKTKEFIDIPKEDVKRIYDQELYKTHNGGQLPTKNVNGVNVIDEEAITKFAKKMDHTVTDRTGADAFGRGDHDLNTILDKQTNQVKEFEDITSITKTMEHKSNEWFENAAEMREEAMELAADKGNKSAVDQLLRQAESTQAEGVRQMVKVFDDQVAQQIKAVAARGKNIKVPDKLMKSMRILDQIGKPDGITMAQAEAILKGMNTSIEDVAQQSSAMMEVIAKFK